MNYLLAAMLVSATCLCSGAACADDFQRRQQVTGEARQSFERILDLWRQEQFDQLYDHLVTAPGSERWYFVNQLNYSARRPACCWEKLQDVAVVYLDDVTVLLTARLGIEVEGFGTRFVTRSFRLVKQTGVWRLPEADILSLAEPNMQRIPREILNRPY